MVGYVVYLYRDLMGAALLGAALFGAALLGAALFDDAQNSNVVHC